MGSYSGNMGTMLLQGPQPQGVSFGKGQEGFSLSWGCNIYPNPPKIPVQPQASPNQLLAAADAAFCGKNNWHMFFAGADGVPVISCCDRAILINREDQLVRDNLRALGVILDTKMKAPFEPRLHVCGSAVEVWRKVGD